MAETWLKCSACKNPIAYGATHWVCSVSTCNRSRTRLVFCTVSCWDSHVAILRHRDAWAVDAKAPTKQAWEAELAAHPPEPAAPEAPKPAAPRRVVGDASPATAAAAEGLKLAETEREVLIVVSKMKKYIKDRSGMNCGDAVADVLSEHIRAICDEAIRAAGRNDRKTVLERDVPRPPRR
jgi:hypothetical protein